MNIGVYECSEHEAALINKYGFVVTDDNNHFVVKHPKHKKLQKYTGGNLYALLCEAARDTDRLEAARPTKAKGTITTASKTPSEGATVQETAKVVPLHPTTEKATPDPPEPIVDPKDEKEAERRFKAGLPMPVAPTPKKPKQTVDNQKFLQTMVCWLQHPNATPKEIMTILNEKGLSVKESSTKMLQHMLKTAIRALELVKGKEDA